MITNALDAAWRNLMTLVKNQPKFTDTIEGIKYGKSIWPSFTTALSQCIDAVSIDTKSIDDNDDESFATVREFCKWLGRTTGVKILCMKNNRGSVPALYINLGYRRYLLLADGRFGSRADSHSAYFDDNIDSLFKVLEYLARRCFKDQLQAHQVEPHCIRVEIYDPEANWA